MTASGDTGPSVAGSPPPVRPAERALDRATAAALTLPPLALALPWLLAGDLEAEATGAGWALLFSVPLLVLLVLRRAAPRPRGLLAFAGFAGAALVSTLAFPPADTFASDRAVALMLTAAAALLGGASLDRPGVAWLLRGTVAVSLAASLGALLGGAPFAGPLQNSGASSELALPGALVGAWLFARDRTGGPVGSTWRWLGLAALLAELGFAARAPVLTALVAFAALLPLGILFARGGDRRRMAAAAGLAVAALAIGWTVRAGEPVDAGPVEMQTARPIELELGGVEVRKRIWSTLPRLALDHPWFGVGPGQFAAAYPPYRDPVERALSDRPLGGRAQSEVEHAHSDWLQGPLEVGLVGGALWLLFLLTATLRASAELRGGAPSAALAAGALGVLVNALFRAPLLHNPAAAPLAFALFGAVLAQGRRGSPGSSGSPGSGSPGSGSPGSGSIGRAAVFLVLVGSGLHLASARAIARHGALLGGWPECLERYPAALEARPDSVAALSLAARAAEARAASGAPAPTDAPTGAPDPVAAWSAVLDRRPHRREALIQAGNAHARAGQLERAGRRWRYALALDPDNPAILGNLMRGAAFAGDVEGALAWHERAGFEADRLALLAFALLQEQADVEAARALLDRAEPRYRDLTANRAHALAGELEAEGEAARARVLRGYAQLVWARQHVEQGDPAAAVRSYRQALAGLSTTDAEGASSAPDRVRYELSAALALSGRTDEARDQLGTGASHDARILRELPAWVGDAILPLLVGSR